MGLFCWKLRDVSRINRFFAYLNDPTRQGRCHQSRRQGSGPDQDLMSRVVAGRHTLYPKLVACAEHGQTARHNITKRLGYCRDTFLFYSPGNTSARSL